MSILANLQPKRVFEIFEAIAAIPHGSGNTAALGKWCCSFVERLGIPVKQDSVGNVIAYKPGSAGREQEAPVILQAHLDMVCEKAADKEFDFLKEGIPLATDGKTVWAQGTTLGADNGIGLAMILAILEDKTLSHPPIEGVLTVDEETGLEGAGGLDFSDLTGRRMINLDSEDEGVFTAGCAGGVRLEAVFSVTRESNSLPVYALQIKGLAGGHSGIEINKGRQNANRVLADLLRRFDRRGCLRLVSISGGTVDNAIAAEAGCVIATDLPMPWLSDVIKTVAFNTQMSGEKSVTISLKQSQADSALDEATTKRILSFMNETPNGVQAMCADLPDLVETSLNLGVVRSTENSVSVLFSLRSSVEAEKQKLLETLREMTLSAGATPTVSGNYPGWEYRPDSPLREKMMAVFGECYGRPPVVEVIHAGLECGLFCEKCPDLDAISMGPDMKNVHTPDEQVSVASVKRVYEYLIALLKQL